MFVEISNRVSVRACRVDSVEVEDSSNRLTVTMFSGKTYSVPCRYNMSIWATQSALVKEIEAAVKGCL